MKFLSTVALAAGFILASLSPEPVYAQQKRLTARVAIAGTSTQLALLAMNVARTKGFIRDEGLDMEVTDYGSGSKGLQALVGRNADITIGVHEHTLVMQAKGVDLRSFVVFSNAPGIVIGVSKSFAPMYKSAKDLKGGKIGVSAPGSSSQLLLNRVLVQNGLKPDDVSVIGVGMAGGAIAAVRTGGELQAIVNYDPVIAELERAGDIKVVLDLRSMEATKQFYKRELTFLAAYTSAEYMQKNPEVCQALATGVIRALKWMRSATSEEILAAVPEEYWKSNRDLYLASIEKNRAGFSPDGRFSAEGTQTLYEGLMTYDKDVMAAKLDLSKTYDTRFIERAHAKLDKK